MFPARFLNERMEKEKLEGLIEELREQQTDGTMAEDDISPVENIPRPAGTCGRDWGLQIEMGLSGSSNKDAKYAALLVNIFLVP